MFIQPEYSILGFNFHSYGMIIGLAVVAAISLIEIEYSKFYSNNNKQVIEKFFWQASGLSLVFSILGARLWHVLTDFYLYRNNLVEIFYIWNGGLSIFGGILGGIVGLYLAVRFFSKLRDKLRKVGVNIKNKFSEKTIFLELLDLIVFGLPLGQVIGRLGNYANQELYGVPTNFWFKIYIAPENRLRGYENIEYYHPLFFYEMIAMFLFFCGVYYFKYISKINGKFGNFTKVGTGNLFLSYIFYYSVIRFLLDFLRLDKVFLWDNGLGLNQAILAGIIILSGGFCVYRKRKT